MSRHTGCEVTQHRTRKCVHTHLRSFPLHCPAAPTAVGRKPISSPFNKEVVLRPSIRALQPQANKVCSKFPVFSLGSTQMGSKQKGYKGVSWMQVEVLRAL